MHIIRSDNGHQANGQAKDASVGERMEPLPTNMPVTHQERVKLLQQLLGEQACRQIGVYPIPAGFKLSVVIPVYNEERWIRELVRRVQAVPIPKEIIVVDDCSTDGTRDILRELEGDGRARLLPARRTRARGPPCAPASRTPPATWSSCRTPTWSTTRPSIRG